MFYNHSAYEENFLCPKEQTKICTYDRIHPIFTSHRAIFNERDRARSSDRDPNLGSIRRVFENQSRVVFILIIRLRWIIICSFRSYHDLKTILRRKIPVYSQFVKAREPILYSKCDDNDLYKSSEHSNSPATYLKNMKKNLFLEAPLPYRRK